MKKEDLENLEKVTGQLEGLHREISLLAKKSSNDALNKFKLKMLNAALDSANGILGRAYKPIDGFDQFDIDDVTSNSDATVVLSAYLEELERYRADHIKITHGAWHYVLNDGTIMRAAPPKKLKVK
jgi:hypothetical protein